MIQSLNTIIHNIHNENNTPTTNTSTNLSQFPGLSTRTTTRTNQTARQTNETRLNTQQSLLHPYLSNTFTSPLRNTLNVERDNDLRISRPSLINDTLFQAILRNLNEDVLVHPSRQQIRRATEVVNYNEETQRTINDTRCPISLEDFQPEQQVVRIIHCGHTFSREPLMNWFRRNVRCPVCRYDIRDYTSNEEENEEEIQDTSSNSQIVHENRPRQVVLRRMNSSDSVISDVSDNPVDEINYIMYFPTTSNNEQN